MEGHVQAQVARRRAARGRRRRDRDQHDDRRLRGRSREPEEEPGNEVTLPTVCGPRSMVPDPARVLAGIVLAAGASTRMGGNKLFFELEGETLLRRAVRAAVSAGLDPVLVVLGHEAERARG